MKYPQILFLLWFAWVVWSETYQMDRHVALFKDALQALNAPFSLSDNAAKEVVYLAIFISYGPALLFLYLGGFFK